MIKPFLIAAAIVGVVAPGLAQDGGEGAWVRSSAASEHYSIETPCTLEAVERDSAEPLQVGVQTLDQASSVNCVIGETVFASGIVSVSEEEIGDENIFEVTLGLLEQEVLRPEVKLSFVELDGRRAMFSRERRGDRVAQTSIVELSNREMLMIISGGKPIGTMDMDAMIDRHVGSLKVASK